MRKNLAVLIVMLVLSMTAVAGHGMFPGGQDVHHEEEDTHIEADANTSGSEAVRHPSERPTVQRWALGVTFGILVFSALLFYGIYRRQGRT